MRALAFTVLISVFAATSAHAAFWSGQKLVEFMKENEKVLSGAESNTYHAGVFDGFIAGVFDAHEAEFPGLERVTLGQMTAVVINYLKSHPEEWHLPAVELVLKALREAFPR